MRKWYRQPDPDKSEAHEAKLDALYKQFYGKEHYWELEAFKQWRSERNRCPQCASTRTAVENHDVMWGEGDLICQDCGTYVRDWDAG